ncbi:MAG: hypothetical protein FJX76_27290, partial [Armatimonadetes bacterium]|nr:hypothetical protein [Armatimonadota bacterium]
MWERNCQGGLAAGGLVLGTGTVLQGRYRIVEPLNEGGMSVVYLATDSVLGNRVAIKEMKDHFLSPAERDMAASQFLQEAQILANLEHAGLPRVTNFFQDTNRHYLVMDYIRGETLEALANRNGGRLAEETVLRVASEVSRVLDYLHSSKPAVIFRDLKPSNIMLTDDGRVKLIDFGISKGFDAGGGTRTIIRGAGTPGFAPPEQYGTHGRSRTDARSDVYSLGATMYTLLTGEIPVEATDRWMHGIPLSAPRSLNPGVSSDTESLVLRMMELRPDDRPSTARAVLEEVRTYRPELTLPGDVTSVFPAAAMPAREPAPETPRPPTPGPATPEPAVPPRPVRRFRSSVSAAAEADASPAIDEDEPTRGMYPFVGSASSGARAAVAAVAAPPNGTLVAEAAPVASAQAVASAATQAPQETASAQAPVDASGPQAPVDASGAQAQAAP